MESREKTDLDRFEQLRQSLIAAAEQADRGELLDGDEVFDEVLRELEEAVAAELANKPIIAAVHGRPNP